MCWHLTTRRPKTFQPFFEEPTATILILHVKRATRSQFYRISEEARALNTTVHHPENVPLGITLAGKSADPEPLSNATRTPPHLTEIDRRRPIIKLSLRARCRSADPWKMSRRSSDSMEGQNLLRKSPRKRNIFLNISGSERSVGRASLETEGSPLSSPRAAEHRSR